MLTVNKVTKDFYTHDGIVHALKNISMKFSEGEMVAIVGESGSGKTTLLNIISGLINPDAGNIRYYDEIISQKTQLEKLRFRKAHIGMIMQDYYLLNDRNIYENIELPLRIRHYPQNDRKQLIEKYLREMNLYEKRNEYPEHLSGGQQQRVSIARALICDPDIILADEPTGALDEENAYRILKILRMLADTGKIVIMVTHQLKNLSFCDRYYSL